jgi:Flp pilus assembly protein TadD
MNRQAATLDTNTGVQQLRQGDVEGSIEKFRAALKLSPDFAAAHFQLGVALHEKGDVAQASAEFEKAHQLDPHLKPPQFASTPPATPVDVRRAPAK